jgi:hypothetical protein
MSPVIWKKNLVEMVTLDLRVRVWRQAIRQSYSPTFTSKTIGIKSECLLSAI